MALYPPAPPVILLKRIKALLEAVDWQDLAGEAVTIRHYRNRPTRDSERPCIAVRFEDDNPEPDMMSNARNFGEYGRILQLRFVIDRKLDSESSDLDETAVEGLMRLAAIAYDAIAIQTPDGDPNGLWDYADDTRRDETGPDDDSNPDEGRLEQGISVIYRVSSIQPNRLLRQE